VASQGRGTATTAEQEVSAVLTLARDVRRALRERDESIRRTIDRYDGATQRLDLAGDFIRTVHKEDLHYENLISEALERYQGAMGRRNRPTADE
jgi:hypothetical protein